MVADRSIFNVSNEVYKYSTVEDRFCFSPAGRIIACTEYFFAVRLFLSVERYSSATVSSVMMTTVRDIPCCLNNAPAERSSAAPITMGYDRGPRGTVMVWDCLDNVLCHFLCKFINGIAYFFIIRRNNHVRL